jgi:hypothetical protein
MKMQPEREVIAMYHDPRHADSRDMYPALQISQADLIAAENRYDHLLRAALLANGCAARKPAKQ